MAILGLIGMKKHLGVWLPDEEKHLLRHIRPGADGFGVYQYKKFVAALELCNKVVGDTKSLLAVDIGCHVGLWAKQFCKHFKHTNCFDPCESNLRCFEENLKQELEDGLVSYTNHGLGDKNSTCRVVVDNKVSGNATVVEDTKGDVFISPLDSFHFLSRIGLIKIDVEGYEYFVIKGGEETLKSHYPVVVIEQKPQYFGMYGVPANSAVDLLKEWGWRTHKVLSGDHIMAHERSSVPHD